MKCIAFLLIIGSTISSCNSGKWQKPVTTDTIPVIYRFPHQPGFNASRGFAHIASVLMEDSINHSSTGNWVRDTLWNVEVVLPDTAKDAKGHFRYDSATKAPLHVIQWGLFPSRLVEDVHLAPY